MSLLQKTALHLRLRLSRAALWVILAVWGGSTLAAMWWLNPVSPASLSLCTSPALSVSATPVVR